MLNVTIWSNFLVDTLTFLPSRRTRGNQPLMPRKATPRNGTKNGGLPFPLSAWTFTGPCSFFRPPTQGSWCWQIIFEKFGPQKSVYRKVYWYGLWNLFSLTLTQLQIRQQIIPQKWILKEQVIKIWYQSACPTFLVCFSFIVYLWKTIYRNMPHVVFDIG